VVRKPLLSPGLDGQFPRDGGETLGLRVNQTAAMNAWRFCCWQTLTVRHGTPLDNLRRGG
jgi:hypothetical protein